MDDHVTLYSKVIESSPAIVAVLLGFLTWSWHYFMRRENRLEEREIARVEKMEGLTREMLQALHNNTIAMENLRRAIEDKR